METREERIQRLEETAREVRLNIIRMVYEAQSGHPGGSLSLADIATALYFDIARLNPKEPRWPDRDRILLSKGHGCPVIYACLAMRGYFSMKELKTLRKFGSILQGHPYVHKTPGLDISSGSLGHGLSHGVGMALDGRLQRKDYTVYVLIGDGELDEGQNWEAAASAAKFKLDNLVAVLDANKLQNDSFTKDIMPMEPLDKKFEAFNWRTIRIDGHDMDAVVTALETGRDYRGGPFCIIADTVKGKGVSYMENVAVWHGKVPSKEQYEQALREIRGK